MRSLLFKLPFLGEVAWPSLKMYSRAIQTIPFKVYLMESGNASPNICCLESHHTVAKSKLKKANYF